MDHGASQTNSRYAIQMAEHVAYPRFKLSHLFSYNPTMAIVYIRTPICFNARAI